MEPVVLNALAKDCGFAAWYHGSGSVCHLEDKPIHVASLGRDTISAFVLQFWSVSRHGSNPTIGRVDIDVRVHTVTFQVTTSIDQTSDKLSPLYSEIESSCFSFGTNALSAASSTIR